MLLHLRPRIRFQSTLLNRASTRRFNKTQTKINELSGCKRVVRISKEPFILGRSAVTGAARVASSPSQAEAGHAEHADEAVGDDCEMSNNLGGLFTVPSGPGCARLVYANMDKCDPSPALRGAKIAGEVSLYLPGNGIGRYLPA